MKSTGDFSRYNQGALEGEVERVRNAPKGERNNTVFKSTAALGELVHLGLDEQMIRDRIYEAAEANGLVADTRRAAVLKTIDSGMERGLANPRHVAANQNDPAGSRPEGAFKDSAEPPPVDAATPIRYPAWKPADGGKEPWCIWTSGEPPVRPGEVERYRYRHASEVVRIKVKMVATDGKAFSNYYKVHRDDGKVGWQAQKPAGFREIPFTGALDPFDHDVQGEEIWWPEGEKDVNSLTKINILAITFGGTSDLPSGCEKSVAGCSVVICADNDDTGREHAERKALLSSSVANAVRVLHFPDKPGGDVSDWLAAGHSEQELRQMAEAAPLWQPAAVLPNDAWDDPDWTILIAGRGSLPAFPVDTLSPEWQGWLLRSAHGAGVTPDHVIVPLLAIASSLIGTARRIRASRPWSEPFTLWTAVIGDSGTGKTPGLGVTKRALVNIERSRRDRIAELQRAHETKAQAAKDAEALWKEEVKAAVADSHEPPLKPAEATSPGEFVAPRLFVSNATIERIARLFQGRPSGMLVIADELAGLFLNMSRYSKGQDNEFWLESWNGESFVVERVSAPPLMIDHLLVGITGGFQPDKLSLSLEGKHDGMYARILFGWPREPQYQPLSDDMAEVEPEILNALGRLIDLPAGEEGEFAPRHVDLSAAARNQFEQFRQFLHVGKSDLDGREREWWAKGPAHVLRLAGTLAYLDWSMQGGPEPSCVEVQFVDGAVRIWKEYFLPHSLAAVRRIGISDQHVEERRVLNWLRSNNSAIISVQDVRRDALSQTLDAAKTEQVISRLVTFGWLRPVPPSPGSGRPALRWQVNPKLLGMDAETAETAESAVWRKAG